MSGPDARPPTPGELEEIRAGLEQELAKLERSMGFTEDALRPVELDQAAMGRLSRIDLLQAQGLTRNLREREQLRLGAIVGALRRMEEGSYGFCRVCRSPIPLGRLLVMPEADNCAGCPAG